MTDDLLCECPTCSLSQKLAFASHMELNKLFGTWTDSSSITDAQFLHFKIWNRMCEIFVFPQFISKCFIPCVRSDHPWIELVTCVLPWTVLLGSFWPQLVINHISPLDGGGYRIAKRYSTEQCFQIKLQLWTSRTQYLMNAYSINQHYMV